MLINVISSDLDSVVVRDGERGMTLILQRIVPLKPLFPNMYGFLIL